MPRKQTNKLLQKCNFSQVKYKLPEGGPGGPKHVGANVGYLM